MTEAAEAPTYATAAQVAAWVGLPHPGDEDNDAALLAVTTTANWTVGRIIGSAAVPADVAAHAALALASDLYEQRNAPNGIRLFTDDVGGAAPVRVRADAAGRARAILAPFLPPAFA